MPWAQKSIIMWDQLGNLNVLQIVPLWWYFWTSTTSDHCHKMFAASDFVTAGQARKQVGAAM